VTLTCSLLLALAVSTRPAIEPRPVDRSETLRTATVLADAVRIVPLHEMGEPRQPASWTVDRPERRPAALPAMYAALGALNALDVYATRRAMHAGAYEGNPLMDRAAESSGTMLAVKALSTAGTIYFTERAWKKNRKGAVIMMALINGAMAAITIQNLRHAQR
jgi:Domain of unknown function (DUF5658)